MRRTPFHPARLLPRLGALAEPCVFLALLTILRFT